MDDIRDDFRDLAFVAGWGGDADTNFQEHVLKFLTTEGEGGGYWNVEVTKHDGSWHYGQLADYRTFTGRSGDSVPAVVLVPLDRDTGEDTNEPEVVIRLSDIARLIVR